METIAAVIAPTKLSGKAPMVMARPMIPLRLSMASLVELSLDWV
jgi:hypothetical protein